MPQIFDNRGNTIGLGKELGRGGEGGVFALSNPTHSGFVAKIYHNTVDQEKSAKLSTMTSLVTSRLTQLAAWPVGTIHTKLGGSICGFIMPRVPGKEIHLLYSPQSRLQEFPGAGWAFLLHSAANVARAVAVIHEHNHVIGDINQNTFFVSDQATVMLIDCDSFQVSSQGHHFLCEVGVDIFTPPELQGKAFRGIIRTQNHDCFGLAVLIFQLLFMGRHPFAGRYSGPEVKPLERLIAENRFAYGNGASARQMSAPPGTLPLSFVSQPVANLFERAFATSGNASGARPKPQEWIESLSSLAKYLRVCAKNPAHQLPHTSGECPWCIIESRLGVLLFGAKTSGGTQSNFDINIVWAKISRTIAPTLVSCPTPIDSIVEPENEFVAVGNQFRRTLGLAGLRRNVRELRNSAKTALVEKRTEYDQLVSRWEVDITLDIFKRKFEELEQSKNKWLAMESERGQRIQALHSSIQQQKMSEYLKGFSISSVKIPQVGPGRVARLSASGIYSAADVTRSSVSVVNHVGAESSLLAWRQQLEGSFTFDPNRMVKQADIQLIASEISHRQAPLEECLLSGRRSLEQITARLLQRQRELVPLAEQAARALAQAEANNRCFSILAK